MLALCAVISCIATSTMTPKCVICCAVLEESCKRRVLCSPESAVTDVYTIFKLLVQPKFVESASPSYVCRNSCFATLQKLVRHTSAANSLLREIGAPLLAPWRHAAVLTQDESPPCQV